MKKSILVFGPSGVGKTDASKKVAKELKIEYSSADYERDEIYKNLSLRQKNSLDALEQHVTYINLKAYQESGKIHTDSPETIYKTIEEIRINAALYSTEGIRRQSLYNILQNDYTLQIGDLGFCTLYYQNLDFKEEAKQILKSFKTILLLPCEDIEKSVEILRWRHMGQICSDEMYRQKVNRMLLEKKVYEEYKPDYTIYVKNQTSDEIAKKIIKINNN